jgi:hypothetical protein
MVQNSGQLRSPKTPQDFLVNTHEFLKAMRGRKHSVLGSIGQNMGKINKPLS